MHLKDLKQTKHSKQMDSLMHTFLNLMFHLKANIYEYIILYIHIYTKILNTLKSNIIQF